MTLSTFIESIVVGGGSGLLLGVLGSAVWIGLDGRRTARRLSRERWAARSWEDAL